MKHVARKRFGQHFLVDDAVIARIVGEIDPRPGQALVEIGPGLGALTQPVLDRGVALTLVEIDRDLAARWRREAERGGERGSRLRVIEADALALDWRALATERGQPLRLIGNLPYNISSPILFALLPVADAVVDQHFMLQKEVVDRMVADPGSRTFGRLSVMLQWRYALEAWAEVPPEAFDPPPQVDSAMVHMVPRPMQAAWAAQVAAVLEPLAQAAFSQRRKLLRHALEPWIDCERAQRGRPELPPFDLQRRAEEVPVEDYVALATALAGVQSAG